MPETKISCLRCQSDMDIGYVQDQGQYSGGIAKWIMGSPDKRWYGINTEDHLNVKLVAYRCRACGYVELRAPKRTAD